MKPKYLILILFMILVLGSLGWVAQGESEPETIKDMWFTGAEGFSGTDGAAFVVVAEGLTMDEAALTAVYQSPILTAPLLFNALVPAWQADLPAGTSMTLAVRTSSADGRWGEWQETHTQPDWITADSPQIVGDMLAVPAEDITHQFVQFSVTFNRAEGAGLPLLRQLRFTVIDSTAGPTTEEMVAQQQALNEAQGLAAPADATTTYPKPFVISRAVWCTNPDCNYTDLQYSPFTHLIIHHTVSNNATSDWAANVRAIWQYHTYTQNWGDIGYNYLVDPNGNLYEGHLGGDDVIGIHSGDANKGSMALALLGTFSTYTPPAPMMESAANLFAWKASQRGIDVYDASTLPNMSWGTPNLMGHRDVYGGTNTSCPGDEAYGLLPNLRDMVAQRIGYVSPYIYVDELSPQFTMSQNGGWFEGPAGCGNNGHSYYTWSVTDPNQSTNWGVWRPNVPSSGRYEIQVYAPYCDTNSSETSGATYTVHHANGDSTVVVSHNAHVGLWMSLGAFDLNAGSDTTITLTDLTTTDADRGVWFDAIRLRPAGVSSATVTNQAPPDGWVTTAVVPFQWVITNPGIVQNTTLKVATDANFANVVLNQSWAGAVNNYTATFSQNYPDLYWQVSLATSGGPATSTTTHFRLDYQPPASSVQSLTYYTADNVYTVNWGGSDNGSGIATYSVAYRQEGSGTWTPLVTNVTAVTANFTPPVTGAVYWFRAQAVDSAGNVEPTHAGNGDINTQQATVIAPQVSNSSPADHSWSPTTAVAFVWNSTNSANVQNVTLQVATDVNFANLIANQIVPASPNSATLDLGQEYGVLYWRVVLNLVNGVQAIVSTPTQFGIDVTVPATAVEAIYRVPQGYMLAWSGSDNLSGISGYMVDYAPLGSAVWTRWLNGTQATNAIFTPPDGQVYLFRAQAIDNAGNISPLNLTGDVSSANATPLPYALALPIVRKK